MASSLMTFLRNVLLAIVCLGALAATSARAEVGYLDDTQLAAWGLNGYGQTDVPAGWDFTQVAGAWDHSLAVKSDGSLAGWGRNDDGQADVPAGNDFTQVAAGYNHSLALKSDGSLAAWGNNGYGQTDVPAVGDFTQVAGGSYHSLALKSDGSLVAWGWNGSGQTDVPAGNDFSQVTGGRDHSLALKSDGSLAGWGLNTQGQTDVPAGNDFTQVAGGGFHSLAMKSDGSLAAWGANGDGQTDVPAGNDFTQVAAGMDHSLALKSDGSLAAWGRNSYGQCNVPEGYFLAIGAADFHSLAIQARTSYDDLLVSGSGAAGMLQRPIDVAGDATIESMMEMTNNPTMTVAGRTTIRGTGGIRGAGTIVGQVRAEYGSRIIATGGLTLGDSTQFGALLLDGELHVGANTLTLNDRTTTQLGRLTVVEGGTLAAPNGLLVAPGTSLAGMGTVSGRFINQGLVAAGGPGEDLTFNDSVSGAGSFTGSIIFNGGFTPGNSPVTQHFDWATFTANNTLTMEFAGTLPGEYDQLIINESVTLDGTLNLTALSRLMPVGLFWGDHSFQIISGTVNGQFADGTQVGDYLGHGLFLTDTGDNGQGITYNMDSVVVDVLQAAPGDTDGNRKVEGPDILAILTASLFGDGEVLNPDGTYKANWKNGDFDGNHKVEGPDILMLLTASLFGDGVYGEKLAAPVPGAGADVKLVVTDDGLVIDAGDATVTGFVLSSESGILTGDDAENLGLFQEDTDATISGAFAMQIKGEHVLGDVIGQTDVDLRSDLTLAYTIAGEPGIFTASVVVPEPGTLLLLLGGLVALLIRRRM